MGDTSVLSHISSALSTSDASTASSKLFPVISVELAHIGLPRSPKAHKLPADTNLRKSLLVNLLTIAKEPLAPPVRESAGQ